MKYPRKLLHLLLISLVSFFSSTVSYAQVQTARYTSMTTNTNGYYEYLPEGYSSGTGTYPLIIFLHGSGERGDGSSSALPKMLNTGLPRLIQQGQFPKSFTVNGQTHRFIVISPQFVDWPKPVQVNSIIDYVISHYRVNISRIYVTGLSMGGGATWEYAGDAALYVNRLAAIVPIAGASYNDKTRSNRIADANLAVWATHNNGDPTVPVSYTEGYIANILARNPSAPVKKTIFTSTSHDAWSKTYDPNFREGGLNVYEWMLQYQKGGATPPPVNQSPVAHAGPDVVLTFPANSTLLNGSLSKDADGSIRSYAWSKTSGPAQFVLSSTTTAKPVVSNLVAGTYVFRLTVTDNLGATAYDDISITIKSAATAPPATPVSSKIIKVNIYGAGDATYNNSEWNNWNFGTIAGKSVASAAFNYSDGTTSGVSAVLSHTEIIKDNGPNYGSGIAPAEVLRYTSYSTVIRTLTISGLSTSKRYSFELYSSRAGSAGNSSIFSVNGASQTINSANNLTVKAAFNNIAPDAQGRIVINIQKAGTYSYLNGFTITESTGTTTTAASTLTALNDASSLGMASSFELYPNPVADKFTLQMANEYRGPVAIQVIDMSGTVRKEFKSTKDQDQLTASYSLSTGFAPGNYVVRVVMGNAVNTVKIIKQ